MEQISLKFGDILYQEGDPSDAVYFVEAGRVEVRRKVDRDEATVASLGKGEILGEMGVIAGVPRSASIVAASDVELVRLDAAAFKQAFGGPDGIGLKILKMICSRLAASNVAFGAPIGPEAALRRDVSEIRILGDTRQTSRLLGNTGAVVKSLPFDIGTTGGAGAIKDSERLLLPIGQGDQTSAGGRLRFGLTHDGHIALSRKEGDALVTLNGEAISAGKAGELRFGDNQLVFGGERSLLRFVIRVRRARDVAA